MWPLSSSKITYSPTDLRNFKVIIDHLYLFGPIFLQIINLSFIHEKFIADKHATITLIHKKSPIDSLIAKTITLSIGGRDNEANYNDGRHADIYNSIGDNR